MVYAVNLALGETGVELFVQITRRGQVAPERLFDHNARPAVSPIRRIAALGDARRAEQRPDVAVEGGRCRKVENAIALRAALLVKAVEQLAKALVTFEV